MSRILIADDHDSLRRGLAQGIAEAGHDVEEAANGNTAIEKLHDSYFDVIVSDLKMGGSTGLEVLKTAKQLHPTCAVILMTAFGTIQTAVEAMKAGAFDYVQKPFDNEELKALVRRALDLHKLSRENRYLRAALRSRYALDGDDVVAESPAIREVFAIVRRAAASRATVLISGESGTGKELVARAVHYYSDRVGGPFLAVNCKALAESLLESELFGHEKGAFTGAQSSRAGLFERAHGGTLFLDEIGEVSLNFQGKLLRVLQDRTVQRVGGDTTHTVDVRVVAATNRELKAEVAAGRFREDLYFRLAVIPVQLPPLRDRRADILPLAQHFLRRHSAELSRRIVGFTEEVEQYLSRHSWPGNVRELENTVERGVVMASGELVELADLLLPPMSAARAEAPASSENSVEKGLPAAADLPLQAYLDRAAKEHVRAALFATRGARSDAARQLGIDRTTLYRLMKKYGLDEEGPG
jgi:two-component system response regulator HydG